MSIRNLAVISALSILFSFFYLNMAYLLPQSEVSFHARLIIVSPFVYRLLIPYTLGLILPAYWLDAYWLKLVFACVSVFATLYLMPRFTNRITGLQIDAGRALNLSMTSRRVGSDKARKMPSITAGGGALAWCCVVFVGIGIAPPLNGSMAHHKTRILLRSIPK